MKAMTSSFIKQLLPRELCRHCRSVTTSAFLCDPCRSELPRLGRHRCQYCALPLPSESKRCPECLRKPPAFSSTVASFRYSSPIKEWIQRFKYHGKLGDGRLLVHELLHSIQVAGSPPPDFIVPVPMPPLRQWRRGFNQTQWLAGQLSKQLGIPVYQALSNRPGAHQQAGEKRFARLKNKHKAYRFNPKQAHRIAGKHIALIDDVMTTGATLRNASKILKDSGACRVDLWIIARTAKDNGK